MRSESAESIYIIVVFLRTVTHLSRIVVNVFVISGLFSKVLFFLLDAISIVIVIID
jgi:hypothetical protein